MGAPTYSRAATRSGAVPLSVKLYQGIGTLAGGHKDFAFNTFLLLFYSQLLGLSAALASIAIAIGLVVDAISDPVMGAYSDNFVSRRFTRYGRRHLFMYLAVIPVGLSLYFLFSPPASLSQWALFGWLLFFVVATRLSFTLFVVPYNALPPELSDDYAERTSIYVFRFLVGWSGGLLFVYGVYTFVFPSSDDLAGQLIRDNYRLFAPVLGLLVSTWILLTTFLTRSQVKYLRQPEPTGEAFSFNVIITQVMLALESRNFRLVFLSTLLFSGIAGVGAVFDIYMNTYFWEFSSEQLRWFLLSGFGALLAFVSLPWLQKRFEKQQILRATLALVMVLGMSKVIFRFVGVWPVNHDPALLLALVCHVGLVIYLLTTAGIMFASIVADLVDEQAARVGLRQEGVFASAISFSQKAAPSIGLILGGLLLDYVIHFPAEATPGAVAEDTLFRLALIDGVIIHALFIVPLLLLGRYSLTREDVARLQRRARETVGGD